PSPSASGGPSPPRPRRAGRSDRPDPRRGSPPSAPRAGSGLHGGAAELRARWRRLRATYRPDITNRGATKAEPAPFCPGATGRPPPPPGAGSRGHDCPGRGCLPCGKHRPAAVAARKKILIIEDEPHIVLGLTDALEFEGFGVVSAGKGKDGVQLARQ